MLPIARSEQSRQLTITMIRFATLYIGYHTKQEKVKRNGRNFTKILKKTIANSNLCGSDRRGFACNPDGTKGVLRNGKGKRKTKTEYRNGIFIHFGCAYRRNDCQTNLPILHA